MLSKNKQRCRRLAFEIVEGRTMMKAGGIPAHEVPGEESPKPTPEPTPEPTPQPTPQPTEQYSGSLGRGVFVNVIGSGGLVVRQKNNLPTMLADPDILGTQMSLAWKLIEPQQGRIDFALIDRLARPWWDAGKKIVLEVVWKNRGKEPSVIGVPTWAENEPWVFTATSADPTVGEFKAPIPWHSGYQTAWKSFMTRLAARYDGHSGIELVSFGGPQPNAEPGGYEGEMTPPPGYTPEVYQFALLWNMVMVDQAWKNTQKAAQMKFNQPHSESLMKFVNNRGWVAVSNGFSYKVLDAKWAEEWAERRALWPNAHFGYLEYGPAGIGTASQQQMFEAAANAGMSYVPLSLDVYFGDDIQRAESRAANLWAKQNLRNWKLARLL